MVDTHGDNHRDALKEEIRKPAWSDLGGDVFQHARAAVQMNAYSIIQNQKGEMQVCSPDLFFVDFDYIPQYQLKLVAGRAFSRAFGADTTHSMVLNEAGTRMLGYHSPAGCDRKRFLAMGPERQDHRGSEGFPLSRFAAGDPAVVIADRARRLLRNLGESPDDEFERNDCRDRKGSGIRCIPNRPFSYYFVDEMFDQQYRAEDRFGKLFLYFAGLAIFISCLGLLGLASYSTIQRTKEIGVRKVLGASVGGIVRLLSKDFLWLVGIAFVVATPLSFVLMHKWLKDFAYRIDIWSAWWIFVLAGLGALAIALFTISFQAVKAALANPVNSLRSE